jgi:tetratricopeptide (TPR) repeat protein
MSFADYELEAEIGRGAMGRVHRARHRSTGALRAIKIGLVQSDPERAQRFEREAEALARVMGEEIVPVHETGVERGRHYLVMSFMPGGSLAARLEKAGRLAWRDAVAVALPIARGLARCHEQGIVHRDLKPANVLFDDEGRPRLADFGLVRDLAAASLTETGSLLGTPLYMPPEQLDGKKVDGKADVYALGVVLHELVAGEPPFGATRSVLAMIAEKRNGRRRRLGVEAPRALDALLDRALLPDPVERPTAADLARELGPLLATKERQRRGGWMVLAAGLALAVTAAAFFHAPGRTGTSPAPPTPTPAPPPRPALDERARPAVLARVEGAWRERHYVDAIAACESTHAGDPWTVALLADAFLEAGNVERALALVKEVPPGSAGEARALSIVAFVHATRRDEDPSAIAKRAIELDPKLARAWLARSLALQFRARQQVDDAKGPLLDEALEAAKSAERLAPPCRGLAAVTHGTIAEEIAKLRGGNAPGVADPEMSFDPFGGSNRRTTIDPRESSAGTGEALFLERGRQRYEKTYDGGGTQDLAAAAEYAREATALNPHRAFAHALLAMCDKAVFEQEMRAALALDSWEPWASDWLMRLDLAAGKWAAVQERLERRERRTPGTGAQTALVGVLAAQGRFDDAIAALGSLTSDELNHSDAYRKGALIALHVKDAEAAGRFARLAVGAERQTDVERVLSSLVQARVRLSLDDPDGALKALGRLGDPPAHADAVEAMFARARLAKGDLAKAFIALQRCCEMCPAFDAACRKAGLDVHAALASVTPEAEMAKVARRALELPEAPDTQAFREVKRSWYLVGELPIDW